MAYGRSYKKRIAISKEDLDIEIRNVVRKVSHRPLEEVRQIVNERCHTSIDVNYLAQLMGRQV